MGPLRIRSAQGDYEVQFLESLEELIRRLPHSSRCAIVIDRNVSRHYQKQLEPLFADGRFLEIDATEEEKSFQGVNNVAGWMQGLNFSKEQSLIAIGGGITQDIVAFVAHLYHRGIPWTFVPTTLLAMSDSCIGAKCGINFNSYKNQLGCFHSPGRVLMFPGFTASLEERDLASGYGEIMKLMVIGSRSHFDEFLQSVAQSGFRGPNLGTLIRKSLEVKKSVIEVDEYEKDLRRILNYGHTFGHALETVTDHEVPHGLAVVWGMDLVNYLATRRGILDEDTFRCIHDTIRSHFHFKFSRPIAVDRLVQTSRRDKKAADGSINLVFLETWGKLQIVKTPYDSTLTASIGEYLDSLNVFA